MTINSKVQAKLNGNLPCLYSFIDGEHMFVFQRGSSNNPAFAFCFDEDLSLNKIQLNKPFQCTLNCGIREHPFTWWEGSPSGKHGTYTGSGSLDPNQMAEIDFTFSTTITPGQFKLYSKKQLFDYRLYLIKLS